MTERATSSIPVDTFSTDRDDFGEWVKLFEDAVRLATGATEDERLKVLFRKWLPIKLDARARTIYSNCTKDGWEDLKTEFRDLLIDPQDRYNWQAHRTTITWDGVESFHSLATRVRRSVRLYEKQAVWDEQDFFRFRAALPKHYRRTIDLGCDEDNRTIDEAKKVALRLQMALADGEDAETATATATGGRAKEGPGRTVAFHGAAMADDRLKAMELSMQEMVVKMGNLDTELKSIKGDSSREPRRPDDRSSSRNRDMSSDYRSRDGYTRDRERRESYDRGPRNNSYGRGLRDDSYERGWRSNERIRRDGYDRTRRDSFDRNRFDRKFDSTDRNRQNSYDRYRHDSYDRNGRDSRNHWDSRDSRDSRDSHDGWNDRDNRDSRDNRDRGNGRDQRGQASQDNYRLANLDPQIQWLCAAVAEKEQREQQTKN